LTAIVAQPIVSGQFGTRPGDGHCRSSWSSRLIRACRDTETEPATSTRRARFDHAGVSEVGELRGPAGDIGEQRGHRVRQFVFAALGEEGRELREIATRVDPTQEAGGGNGPDPVAGMFGVGGQHELVGGGEDSGGDDVEVRQHFQRSGNPRSS
jgi:hypothetical protein